MVQAVLQSGNKQARVVPAEGQGGTGRLSAGGQVPPCTLSSTTRFQDFPFEYLLYHLYLLANGVSLQTAVF